MLLMFAAAWHEYSAFYIHKDNYLQADVTVLAPSKAEALVLLERDGNWNVEELQRIEPEVVSLDQPRIVTSHLAFQ